VYWKDLLVSVLHLDVTGTLISAVYCYYDTRLDYRSLGTYSILAGLHLAKEFGVSHYYLGYIVSGNRHMEYKARFRPNEILTKRGWLPWTAADGETVNRETYEYGFPGAEYRRQNENCS